MKFLATLFTPVCLGFLVSLKKEQERFRKVLAPNDDEYDFAEDDDDNPADFSMGQFLDDDDDDDSFVQMRRHVKKLRNKTSALDDDDYDFAEDDDESFIQIKSRGVTDSEDGNEYGDDRLDSGYVSVEERESGPKRNRREVGQDEDEEEARSGAEWENDEEDADSEAFIQRSSEEHPKKKLHRHAGGKHHHHAKHLFLANKHAAEPAEKKAGEHKKATKKGRKTKGGKGKKKSSLLGVTDVYEQLAEEDELEKEGKLNDEKQWEGMDDDDADDDEESFIQISASDSGDEEDGDDYGDDRLDGDMGMMAEAAAENEDED